MSAAELRQAAETLRERAGAATPGPWFVDEVGDFGDKSAVMEIVRWRGLTNNAHFDEDRPTADYVATMHPGVGLALADWLDRAAEKRAGGEDLLGTSRFSTDDDRAPIALARLINGGAS